MRVLFAALLLLAACSGADARDPGSDDAGLHYTGEQRCGYAHRYRLELASDAGPVCFPLPVTEMEIVAPPDGGASFWMGEQQYAASFGAPDSLGACEVGITQPVSERFDGGVRYWGLEMGTDYLDRAADAGTGEVVGSFFNRINPALPDGGLGPSINCGDEDYPLRATAIP